VSMAKGVDGDATKAVQVSFAIGVPDFDALTAHQNLFGRTEGIHNGLGMAFGVVHDESLEQAVDNPTVRVVSTVGANAPGSTTDSTRVVSTDWLKPWLNHRVWVNHRGRLGCQCLLG